MKPPRRTWCSDACVQERAIRTSAASARAHVYDRDKGICALCRLDTDAVEKTARVAIKKWYRRERAAGRPALWRGGVRMNVPPHGSVYVDTSRSLWQADHIVPVAEGGGACGLDNYRTLCVWCHPKETGKLRRRLNARKRETTAQHSPGLVNGHSGSREPEALASDGVPPGVSRDASGAAAGGSGLAADEPDSPQSGGAPSRANDVQPERR